MSTDVKGPLPANWEIAYSEQGEKYFIDHNTGTTQWEDPRDLPEGWEKVEDKVYGTFYVDHINKRTQYERPSNNNTRSNGIDWKNASSALSTGEYDNDKNNRSIRVNSDNNMPSSYLQSSSNMFTRDPSQLRGEILTTRIVKGVKGLGFTLIGNDGSSLYEEFLQIKNVIPGGPAHRDGVLRPGDVLVFVNNECVLGATQSHACRIFQSINVGEMVSLRVCRGYQLFIDPCNKIVLENAYTKFQDEREILIRKGEDGFGFTIFESLQGQRVKKILYPERCENLLEGDTLLQIRTSYPNGSPTSTDIQEQIIDFRGMPHHQLVSILRDCPVGFWAHLLVRRNSPNHRSRTPTAGFRYGEQRSTPVPSVMPRSRTPAPQPTRPNKTFSQSISSPPFSSNNLFLTNGTAGSHSNPRNTLPRQYEKHIINDTYENLSHLRPSSTSLGFATPNYVPINPVYNDSSETVTVNLIRKPNGFGFRIVGGSEEGTMITIGQVVPGGAAADDGRLRPGDEIVEIDGKNVLGESHNTAVQLTQKAAANGHVKLVVRRPKECRRSAFSSDVNTLLTTYDVVLHRNETDGFGFVIISSANRIGSTIGKIIEGSAAARCGQLMIGDRVMAVNGIDIMNLPHNEIVDLIRDSGLSVRLTIAPSTNFREQYNGIQCPQMHGSAPYLSEIDQINHEKPPSASCNQQSHDIPYRSLDRNMVKNNMPSQPDMGSLIPVELDRGPKGFGFSIRGGQEFGAMPLFVLRIAEDGPAARDGRLRIGDQLMEINGRSTKEMTHATAIQLIKQYNCVKLVVRRAKNF